MERNLFRLDLTVLNFDFVASQNNGDVLTNPRQVPVPIGDVLVGDPRRNVEHDDGALSLDVVPVSQPTELFLSGRIPHVEFDRAAVGVEGEGVNFHPERRNVLLLEFTR